MGKGKELTTTLSFEGRVDASLQKAFKQADAMASKSSKSINSAFSKFGSIASKGIVAGFTAVATGITAAGAAAVVASKKMFELGTSFEEASNTIRIGTGATGEALDSLNKSFENVYKSVPTTMETASQTIADFNTRLGLTGESLETLSKQSILLSNMMGEDLNGVIESSSQAFKQWNINAENMDDEMDYIYKVCQSTGMGFNDLMGHMQSSGAVLQDLGYNFNEAASMIANLDKAGINTEQVLKGMKKGLGNIAKDGGDAVAAMNKYTDAIRNAKSESEAITIATDIFGSATAVTMAQAIRTGAMDVNALTAALQATDETIMKAAEDTETFPQKLQKLKATSEVALRPVAEKFLDIANDAIPAISSAVEQIVPVLSDTMNQIAPIMGDLTTSIIPVMSRGLKAAVPFVSDILTMTADGLKQITSMFDKFAPDIESMTSSVLPMMSDFIHGIGDAINNTVPMISDMASEVTPILSGMMDDIFGIVGDSAPLIGNVINMIVRTLEPVLKGLMPVAGAVFQGIATGVRLIGTAIQKLSPTMNNIISSVMPAFVTVGDVIGTLLSSIGNTLTTYLIPGVETLGNSVINAGQGILSALAPIYERISQFITAVLPSVMPLIQQSYTAMGELFHNVLVPIGSWLVNTLGTAISLAVKNIGSAIDVVLSYFEPILPGIIKTFTGITEFLSGVFAGDWAKAWEGIKTIFDGVWNTLKGTVKGVLTAIVKGINGIISGVNNFIAATPAKALEAVGITVKIPTIPVPQFAKGGTVTSPTLAMVGEGRTAETIIPHEDSLRSRQLLKDAIEGVLGKKIADEVAATIDGVEGIAAEASKATASGIKAFAKGGTVTSPQLAIVGDAPETIVPHNSSARSVELLNTAARNVIGSDIVGTANNNRGMSLMTAAAGGTTNNSTTNNNSTYNVTFSPNIQVAGTADKAFQDALEQFERSFEEFMARKEREAFA